MSQYQRRKKYVFPILSQLPMDQWTHQWWGLYGLGFVSLQVMIVKGPEERRDGRRHEQHLLQVPKPKPEWERSGQKR
jgi:hypothetical protein